MVTLKDVAAKAGVSIATVSCALNDSPKVTEKTKQKVLAVVKELDYIPNKTARNLKKRKTETIGLFLSDFGGPFYNDLIQGVQEVTMNSGYDLVVCSTYGGTRSTGYTFLKERSVDGAIVLATNLSDSELIGVSKKNLPLVLLDRELTDDNIYSVRIDNYQGAYSAVEHLVNEGCRSIACLTGPNDSYDSSKRLNGYKDALSKNGIEVEDAKIFHGDFKEQSGYDVAKGLNKSNLPDGIFCMNDEMAIGMITAFEEMGINVPEDVAIVGFDDIRLSSYIKPPLTTVGHPKYDWGREAARIVFAALNEKEQEKATVLSTSLIIRSSSVRSE